MKHPKKIYVWIDKDGDDEYLLAEESVEACAYKGERRIVGIYELKEKFIVSLKVTEEIIKEKE